MMTDDWKRIGTKVEILDGPIPVAESYLRKWERVLNEDLIRRTWVGEEMYPCPLCQESFPTFEEKGRHLENAHGYETLDITPRADAVLTHDCVAQSDEE